MITSTKGTPPSSCSSEVDEVDPTLDLWEELRLCEKRFMHKTWRTSRSTPPPTTTSTTEPVRRSDQ